MTPLRDLLRESDPLTGAESLPETDLAAIRRRLVAEAAGRPPTRPVWQEAVALATVVGLMIGIGATTGRRVRPAPIIPPVGPRQPSEPRQLQFATPGGTRIIWTFDPDFSVKESIP